MKNVVILKENTDLMEEMNHIIPEPEWHREGVGNGLLAEQKSWQGIDEEVEEA